MKLTNAQKSRLWRLSKGAEYHIAGKPEVRALERLGLVETNQFRCTFITPEGRSALSKETGE